MVDENAMNREALSEDGNAPTQENGVNNEKLQALLGALFGGAKRMDSLAMTCDLLSNSIAGVMSVMSDTGMPTERLIDALFQASSVHVASALVSLEAAGRFQPGKTVEGCIDDMMAEFGKRIVNDYNAAKEEAIKEGFFDQKEEDESGDDQQDE